jgi:protein TonB
MQMPFEMHHAVLPNANPNRRILSLGAVGAIHIALLYALVHAMTGSSIPVIQGPIEFVPIVEKTPPVEKPQPVKVKLEDPTAPDVQPPIWTTLPDNNNGINIPRGEPTRPQPPVAPTAAQSVGTTHTTPSYPALAIRMGQQGTVTLHIFVAADGTVDNATVEQSSGSAILDEAAVNWVIVHWLYRPATRDGKPIPSTVQAAVKFDLKNAR